MIRQARTGTLRRDHGELAFHEHELPSTPEIIDLLRPVQEMPAPGRNGHAGLDAPVQRGAAHKIQILCRLLTELVGPVAPLLCEEKILTVGGLSGPRQTDEVIQGLAQEIEYPREAHECVRRAQQALLAVETAEHTRMPEPPVLVGSPSPT